METSGSDRMAARRTFTAIDAARVALHQEPPNPTPRRGRVVEVAARLWCRGLQFPTVRQIGAAMGHRSPSTPLNGFGHLIDIQAGVIRLEWHRIETGWVSAPGYDRATWLARHGRDLLAVDPACLRLPGLVTSAVMAADPDRYTARAPSLAPLYALAAFAGSPASSPGQPAFEPMALAAALAHHPDLAIPA